MKINESFVLRQLADTWIVLPLADEMINFNDMITLNESGALLWKALQKDTDLGGLVQALMAEYDVPMEQARADAEEFVQRLRSIGCLAGE